MAKDRKSWGDPKWTMRRLFVIAICVFCGTFLMLAMILDITPQKIDALSNLVGALAVIVMPVIISYLGIAEAGAVIRDLKQPPGTSVSTTTEVREVVKKQPVVDEVRPPKE